MGNLVFQATLGGQVNLVGPNTASTFNLNVPAVAGTLVTTGDTGTVTNTMLAGSIANAKLTNSSVTVGSTAISLGGTATTVAGLTSLATNTITSAAATNLTIQSAGTTAVTIDTSQNVGIGTTAPSTKLEVVLNGGGVAGSTVSNTTGSEIGLGHGTGFGPSTYGLAFRTTGGSLNGISGSAFASQIISSTSNSNALEAYTTGATPVVFGTNATERMRIDSSGNVLLGTTNNAFSSRLCVQGTAGSSTPDVTIGIPVNSSGNTQLQIYRSASTSGYIGIEAVQAGVTGGNLVINAVNGGNLLVGKTAVAGGVGEKVGISVSTDNAAMYITPTNASFSSTAVYINTTRAASAGFDFFGGYANSTGQFRVTGAGVIYAQNTSIQSISDQRLKENIRDSSDGLSVINALRPVRYDWKEGYGNDQKNQLGFIAQEIESVFPEAVGEWQINKDDETTYKTVGPSSLIPVLVKAIQEQQALITAQAETINALTARVVALEAK